MDVVKRLLGAVLLVLFCAGVAEACPGCKEALFDPGQLPQKLATAKGYAWSIGLMLVVPAGLVSLLAAAIVRAQRRKRAALPRGLSFDRSGHSR